MDNNIVSIPITQETEIEDNEKISFNTEIENRQTDVSSNPKKKTRESERERYTTYPIPKWEKKFSWIYWMMLMRKRK